ncbi:YndJ family protein [Streptomyces sp. NPDC093225]|uniref:YndJ family protein n=1 Tax=Streptomyces sp. NPDC093225 TaxID=3366034 RepID=UPI0038108FD1
MSALAYLVDPVVALGMLVVVPVGLRLVEPAGPEGPAVTPGAPATAGASGRTAALRTVARWWPLVAVPGAAAPWLPRGAPATALAAVYALGTLVLVALAAGRAVRLVHTRSLGPAETAVLTALVSPAVAGTALVAERAGYRLWGFDLDILALTVPHFHFAGFTAALVAGLVCRTVAPGPRARFAAYSVPVGTLIVLAGYFTGDWLELVGALVLTAGMWTVALLTWRELRGTGPDRFTRALLGVSAAVLPVTMVLALSWALGEATGLPHLSLTWTAATHGLGNALGFALCSVLAWHRLRRDHAPHADRAPAPDARPGDRALPRRPEDTVGSGRAGHPAPTARPAHAPHTERTQETTA